MNRTYHRVKGRAAASRATRRHGAYATQKFVCVHTGAVLVVGVEIQAGKSAVPRGSLMRWSGTERCASRTGGARLNEGKQTSCTCAAKRGVVVVPTRNW